MRGWIPRRCVCVCSTCRHLLCRPQLLLVLAGAAGTALPPCLPQRQQRPPCRIDPCPSLTLPQFQALPICPLGTRNPTRAAPVHIGALSSHLPYSPPLDLTSPAPASYNDTLLLPHHILLTCAFRACTRNRCTAPAPAPAISSTSILTIAPAVSPPLPTTHVRLLVHRDTDLPEFSFPELALRHRLLYLRRSYEFRFPYKLPFTCATS